MPSLISEALIQQDNSQEWALYSAQVRAGLIQEPPVRIKMGTTVNRAKQTGIEDDCTGRIQPHYIAADVAYSVIQVVDTQVIGGCLNPSGRFEPLERVYCCLVDESKEVTLSEELAMSIFAADAEPELIASVGSPVPIRIAGIRQEALRVTYAGRRDSLPYDVARQVYPSVRRLKAYEAVYVLHFGSVLAGAVDENGLAALLANPCRAILRVNVAWGYTIVSLQLCDESLSLRLTAIGTGRFIEPAHKELLAYSKLHNQLLPSGSFELGGKAHIVLNMRLVQGGKELHVWREDGNAAWIPATVIEERLGVLA